MSQCFYGYARNRRYPPSDFPEACAGPVVLAGGIYLCEAHDAWAQPAGRALLRQVTSAAAENHAQVQRETAPVLTMELASPLQPIGRGGKRCTAQQPGLFDRQEKLFI